MQVGYVILYNINIIYDVNTCVYWVWIPFVDKFGQYTG